MKEEKNNGSWFKGIKGKLLFTAFLPVVAFAITFGISRSGMQTLNTIIVKTNSDTIPNIQSLSHVRRASIKYNLQLISSLTANSSEKKEKFGEMALATVTEIGEALDNYEKAPSTPEMDKLYEPLKAIKSEYFNLLKQCAELAKSDKPESASEAQKLLDGRLSEINATVEKFTLASIKYYDDMAKSESAAAAEAQKSVDLQMTVVTLLAGISIFAVLLWIASSITRSVGAVASSLTSASDQVSSAEGQLTEAGNSLSQSATESAASLEETVAALEELTSMVQMNSDNAKQAAALSTSSRDAAESGEREIQSLIHSMTEISKSSKKIEEIISVIDDIAFQTNLLALNAAVEAARAGEQGKGFAVVAEAVRALAQRSSAAAKDITTLIKDSVAQIDQGSQVADKSGTVLSNIVNSVKKVSDLNNEISAASSEQATGIQQIGKAMNQLDQSSQANAASAEEIAATSGEINNLAVTTHSLTVELNQVILGASEDSAKSSSAHAEGGASAATSSAPKAPAAKKSSTNILPFRKKEKPAMKASSTNTAQDVIPFDDDNRAKVGTTDGF
ncbi:MAG: methyl-accepting chemotaxis protein [Bdellovibrio sp.]